MASVNRVETAAPQTPAELEISFEERLKAMQLKFKEGLNARLQEIQSCWARVKRSEDNIEALVLLHRIVHTLTGSAGTFSFQKLSVEARALEILLKGLVEDRQELTKEVISQIEVMIATLERTVREEDAKKMNQPLFAVSAAKIEGNCNRVLLIDDDEELSEYLKEQLSHFGFKVRTVSSIPEVLGIYNEFQPDVIISDVSFPEGDLEGIRMMRAMIDELEVSVPIVFISSRQDMSARLEAVRANSTAYFSKPINISALVNKIGELTVKEESDPYHILVVDDDASLVDLTVFVLGQLGMDAHGVTNPLEVLEQISLKKPDLILLDVNMPECSGIELAKVIRQQSCFTSIPIIFLSAESNEEIQFRAVLEGGDDFLNKPVDINRLPTFIESRAKRAREMSALMIRDGLTGLFNHTYIKDLIDTELERSKRFGRELSVAMLDIDYFKKVNDTYGHMVGDQVLRSLSHFLNKRLRKTDRVGRYGGEEFVVVLPDTPLDEAYKLMNNILDNFRKIIHHAEDVEFNVTFSCGVISSLMTRDAKVLTNAMDQALYRAKGAGRNQVILADVKH